MYLSNKHPEEQHGEVPGEEEEGATDPQVVQHGRVQKPCYAVQRVKRAGEREKEMEREGNADGQQKKQPLEQKDKNYGKELYCCVIRR